MLTTILITQTLGAAGRGEITLILSLVGIIGMISGIVAGPAIVYLTPRVNKEAIVFSSILWSLIVIPLLFLILNVSLEFLKLHREHIIHISILSLISALIVTFMMIFYGKNKIAHYSIMGLIQPFLHLLLLGILFLILGIRSIKAIIFSLYVASFVSLIIVFFSLLRWEKLRFSLDINKIFPTLKTMFLYGIIAQLGNLFQYLNYRVDFYILNYFHGQSAVGVYSIGTTISEQLWLLPASIATVLYSKIANTDSEVERVRITRKSAQAAFYIISFTLIFLTLIPSSLWQFIFGKDFGDVRVVIWTLSAGIVVFSLSKIIAPYYAGKGLFYINTMAAGIGLVITIILDIMLIPKFNFVGAGIASSLSYIATTLFLIMKFKKDTKEDINLLRWESFRNFLNEILALQGKIKLIINSARARTDAR